MREIKFRAWNKTANGMLEWYFIKDTPFSELINRDHLVPMQYTGLKDKNGVEIYEGDIVGEEGVYHFIERKGWGPNTGAWKIIGEKAKDFTGKGEEKYIAGYELKVVEWKDTSCGFEPFSDSEGNCGHCGGGYSPKRFEVIGNIYENPELIPLTEGGNNAK